MTHHMTVAEIVGRDEDLERISRFLGNVDAFPGVLLLEGGAGIGKTTLWRAGLAAAAMAGFVVLRSTPSEAEKHLAFAAAADLLAPVADDALAHLPDVQRRALAGALLLESQEAAYRSARGRDGLPWRVPRTRVNTGPPCRCGRRPVAGRGIRAPAELCHPPVGLGADCLSARAPE